MSGIIYGIRFGVAGKVSHQRGVDQGRTGMGLYALLQIAALRQMARS